MKISVEQLSSILSLKEYTEQATREIESSNSIIEQPKNITLANGKGIKVIYQEKDEMKLKYMQVWIIKNQKAYIATYTAEADKFNKFFKQADKIIQSFTISQ